MNKPYQPPTLPPIPNQPPKKTNKKWLFIIGGIVVFWIIGAICAQNEETISNSAEQESGISRSEWETKTLDDLKNTPALIETLSENATVETSIKFLAGTIKSLRDIANKKISDSTFMDFYSRPDVVKLMDENSEIASNALPKVLKDCRNEYVKQLKNKMWEHDIDVSTTNGGTTIWFTAYFFARNANIKEWNDELYDGLKILGFKRVCYKWSKYADDYTYYDIK